MHQNIPYKLAEEAFSKKEMHKLMVGEPPYDYTVKYSSAPGKSDLAEIIPNGIFSYLAIYPETKNIDYLNKSLKELCDFPEGMYSVACFILLHNSYANKFEVLKKIDIKKIASILKHNIIDRKLDLLNAKNSLGKSSEMGLYGVLRSLSKSTVELGGPNFFPEENHGQDEGIKI